MIFIGYAKNHARNCYHMYNPNIGYVTEMRDITWLHRMYHGKQEARDIQKKHYLSSLKMQKQGRI